jgi:hypothetical protein
LGVEDRSFWLSSKREALTPDVLRMALSWLRFMLLPLSPHFHSSRAPAQRLF